MIEPTYSCTQAGLLVHRCARWVRFIAHRENIGTIQGHSWRFTASEIDTLRTHVDPDERRGKPTNR